jgi:hypothetical protein
MHALIPAVRSWVAPSPMRHTAPNDQAHAAAASALRTGQHVVALIGPASLGRLRLIGAIADAVSDSGETLYLRQPFPDPIELHESIRDAVGLSVNIPLEPTAMARAIGVTDGPPLLVVIEEADELPFESWQYLHLLCDSLAGGPPRLQLLLGASFGFVLTLQQMELSALKVRTIVTKSLKPERRSPLVRLPPLPKRFGIIAAAAAGLCAVLLALHWILAPVDRPIGPAPMALRPEPVNPVNPPPSTALAPPVPNPIAPVAGPGSQADVDAEIQTLIDDIEQHVARGDDFGGLGTANLFKHVVTLLDGASPAGRRLVQNLPAEMTDRARRLQAYADVLSGTTPNAKSAKARPEVVPPPTPVPPVPPLPNAVANRAPWTALPANAPPRIIITYSGQDPSTLARVNDLAAAMRSHGLVVDDPVASNALIHAPRIGYFFATDRAAAGLVGDRFGNLIGTAQLDQLPKPPDLPAPGTIQVSIP